jgi:hypothetical protein
MAAVLRVLSVGLSAADLVHDPPGGVDVGGGVASADAGDGFAGGLGEVGEPVGAGGGQLAGVSEQDADVAVSLVAAVAGSAQGGQHRIIVLPGASDGTQVASGCGHERVHLPVQSRHSPSERGM